MGNLDYSRSVGAEALGARLRRVSERIDRDAGLLYSAMGVRFEPRWFGALNQLRLHGSLSVTDIAQRLRINHASVSPVRASLQSEGLIESEPSPSDGRRRNLRLTHQGKAFVERMAPLWRALADAAVELEDEAGGVIEALNRLEAALDRLSLVERARKRLPHD